MTHRYYCRFENMDGEIFIRNGKTQTVAHNIDATI